MIPDRIIEADTLTSDGSRASVEVRIPWYRAIPASCIDDATLTVDGVAAPAESVRWEMNGHTYALNDLPERTDDWWFPLDSAILSGDLVLADPDAEHEVTVELKLYIPYIVTDHGVLRIEEKDTKTMAPGSSAPRSSRTPISAKEGQR